jgi:hypothetical protein
MPSKKVEFRTRPDGVVYPITGGSAGRKEAYSESKTYPTRCPGCAKNVYYFQDENGGKVYFNSMGPPWPKHDCRKGSQNSSSKRPKSTRSKNRRLKKGKISKGSNQEPSAQKTGSENPVKPIPNKRTKGYPRFNSGNYTKSIFRLDKVKAKTAFVYSIGDIYVDAILRREIVMVSGWKVFISDKDLYPLRYQYMDFPVYIISQSSQVVELVTHVIKDGEIEPFRFQVRKVEAIERCLDDVL